MIIFTILIAVVVLLGALVMHIMLIYAELKGYERGLDDAEEIIRECRNDNNMCSKCKNAARFISWNSPYKFCPNCRAKMKGAEE